jgi:uncharacterized protein (TIGR00255 family)
MTGYGLGQAQNEQFHATVQLKTLNSKNLEFHFRVPSRYQQEEIWLKNLLSGPISRGKVTVTVAIEPIQANVPTGELLNRSRVLAAWREAQAIAQELGTETPTLSSLLTLPEMWQSDTSSRVEAPEWQMVQQAAQAALEALMDNRKSEGAALAEDLAQRITHIETLLDEIEPYEAERVPQVRDRIRNALAELQGNVQVSEDRFHQELVYYLEKLDITEEKVRLRAHIAYFREMLAQPESQGRKLQFMVQELWREVNTLGTKSNELNIQKRVVNMKDEIEKVKEQLMNIL